MKLIPLANGGFTIVDAADYDDLIQYRWLLSRNGKRFYVRRFEKVNTPKGPKQKCIYMHRQIMNPPDGMDVDHRFGDGLDNRRENLRICTRVQNSQNSMERAMKEGQQIIFKHPVSGQILTGLTVSNHVIYVFAENRSTGTAWVETNKITEWRDASEAWKALSLQNVRAGNFEWNEGPKVEPIK
jgi:hypothetical protein